MVQPRRLARLLAAAGRASHTFETFVVGRTNALAREASLALAQGRQNGISPLFLVGPPGNGKSHLARAVINEARRNGIERGRHTSAESFTSELLSSIRSGQTRGFKDRFREQCDLLRSRMSSSSRERERPSSSCSIPSSTSAPSVPHRPDRRQTPARHSKADGRLSSQMSSGLVVEVELPDAQLRRKLLIAKASAGGVHLPEPCLDRLVAAVRGSVRDLEGALIQLVATASLLKKPIDLALTEAALRKVADPRGPSGVVAMDLVIRTVADFFGVALGELSSRSRKRSILVPRQLAMFLSHRYSHASLTEIGRALGRDHPAVRNAIQVVERAILERARCATRSRSSPPDRAASHQHRLTVSAPSREGASDSPAAARSRASEAALLRSVAEASLADSVESAPDQHPGPLIPISCVGSREGGSRAGSSKRRRISYTVLRCTGILPISRIKRRISSGGRFSP
jgi:chromosomal replication initiator protein